MIGLQVVAGLEVAHVDEGQELVGGADLVHLPIVVLLDETMDQWTFLFFVVEITREPLQSKQEADVLLLHLLALHLCANLFFLDAPV